MTRSMRVKLIAAARSRRRFTPGYTRPLSSRLVSYKPQLALMAPVALIAGREWA